MTWVKLDDQFADHPKVVAAGPPAAWLFVCGLTYCGRYLTDGFIPAGQVRKLADVDNAAELAERLVEVRLWERVEDGYQVHDYLEYNPTAESVRAKREAKSEAGRRGGQRSAESRRQAADQGMEQAEPEASAQASAQAGAQANEQQNSTPGPSDDDDDDEKEEDGVDKNGMPAVSGASEEAGKEPRPLDAERLGDQANRGNGNGHRKDPAQPNPAAASLAPDDGVDNNGAKEVLRVWERAGGEQDEFTLETVADLGRVLGSAVVVDAIRTGKAHGAKNLLAYVLAILKNRGNGNGHRTAAARAGPAASSLAPDDGIDDNGMPAVSGASEEAGKEPRPLDAERLAALASRGNGNGGHHKGSGYGGNGNGGHPKAVARASPAAPSLAPERPAAEDDLALVWDRSREYLKGEAKWSPEKLDTYLPVGVAGLLGMSDDEVAWIEVLPQAKDYLGPGTAAHGDVLRAMKAATGGKVKTLCFVPKKNRSAPG